MRRQIREVIYKVVRAVSIDLRCCIGRKQRPRTTNHPPTHTHTRLRAHSYGDEVCDESGAGETKSLSAFSACGRAAGNTGHTSFPPVMDHAGGGGSQDGREGGRESEWEGGGQRGRK